LQHYYEDNGVFPTHVQGLEALVERPGNLPLAPRWREAGYLERMPLDPWGNRYRYLYPGLHGEFDLYSLGADNALGGEGEDADIGNWAG
jgi:general secretion pathway protein G